MPYVKKIRIGGQSIEYDRELPKGSGNIWERVNLQPNKRIREIYKEGYIELDGKKIKLTSAISPAEGYHLYNLIARNKFKRILEVGMANGMSSLYMLQALKDTSSNGCLTSIDPFQRTQWKGVGLRNVEAAGLKKQHQLIEKKSYEALPALLSEEQFDMIFIDGMHTFDYTLVDLFYAILLCKIGGVIVIDDIKHPGPAKVVKYIETNYSHLKRLTDIPADTVGSYVKIREDGRSWDFHRPF